MPPDPSPARTLAPSALCENLLIAEFYESTRDDCLRIVLLHVGDRHLAHNLVAEAYTRAWMSWRKVRELEVPRAWVVRTALNTHVSWWRRRRHEVALGNHDTAMPAEQATAVSGDLLAALRRLPHVSARSSRCGCCWT